MTCLCCRFPLFYSRFCFHFNGYEVNPHNERANGLTVFCHCCQFHVRLYSYDQVPRHTGGAEKNGGSGHLLPGFIGNQHGPVTGGPQHQVPGGDSGQPGMFLMDVDEDRAGAAGGGGPETMEIDEIVDGAVGRQNSLEEPMDHESSDNIESSGSGSGSGVQRDDGEPSDNTAGTATDDTDSGSPVSSTGSCHSTTSISYFADVSGSSTSSGD